MLKRVLLTLFMLSTLALFNACTLPAPATTDMVSETPSDDAAADARGTLRVAYPLLMDGAEILDPASPVNYDLAVVILYDRLVRLGPDGRAAPDLATEWQPSADATEWAFTLREGVTFHDGKPLTSADVAYSFERIFDPDLSAPLASTLSLIDAVETPDEGTVLFRLTQPHADFPLLLVSYMARIIPEGSGDTIGETGIGTGPFQLVSFNADGTTVLAANDEYWRGAPQLAGIELIAIADSSARASAALAGQIDALLNTPAAQAVLFADNPAFETVTFPTGEWSGLVMRTDTPPFDDVRVRKAMRLLADRQAFIDLVLNGQGTLVCDTPVAKTDVYHWETECPQDLEQAKALLTEAGYADGLTVTMHTADTFPEFIPLAEVYQQQAAAAGVTVNIEIVPGDSFWSDIWLTEALYPIAWRQRPADLILNLVWRSTADWNESYYQNPAFDALLDEARQELDFEARRSLYQQAQQILFEEGGHLIPYHINLSHVFSTNVSGIEPVSDIELKWETISKSE